MDEARWQGRAAAAAVALATVYVLWEIRLPLLLRNSTPTFNELGMHLHDPAFLRDHVLPRLTGWSPDYFAGAPVGTFYFPLPSLLTVLVDVLLPYNIAFKLVTALGLMTLPACAYAFGRLHDQDRLTSACLAVSTLPFLLLPTTGIGGSISATVSSEYPYSLSLAVGLLALGLAGSGMRTGRHRAAAAGLVGLAFLLHVIPAAMAVVGVVVLVAVSGPSAGWRARVRWAVPVVVAGVAMAGFLLVPFVLRQRYGGGGIYRKASLDGYLLFGAFAPVLVLALPGVMLAVTQRFARFLVAMAGVGLVVFLALPGGRLWNARFVPFVYLWLCLLAGYVVARAAAFVDEARRDLARGRSLSSPWLGRVAAPFVLLAVVALLWDSPVWRGLTPDRRYDVSHMATLAYQGYERSPDRAEYRDFVGVVRRVAREHGCGRTHWEWVQEDPRNPVWEDPRTGLAALLPYWTDGCLASMQGLLLQSAATAPFVSMANDRLSPNGQPFDSKLPAPGFDVAAGVEDLRALGVRYWLAVSPEAQAAAVGVAGVREVASTGVHHGRSWKVYEIADVSLVEPLSSPPVVRRGVSSSIGRWQDVAVRWFRRPAASRGRVVVDGGPLRGTSSVAGTSISRVRMGTESVSFHVSEVGVPVLVKVSYFPNWRASGARGPWRATPNFMVVVPTAHDVTLRYRQSGVEWLGWVVTVLGVVGLVLLLRAKPVEMPVVEEAPVQKKAKKPAPRKRR